MILATVTTCPQRWPLYQRLRCQFKRVKSPIPLRTFQTRESEYDPRINANLNARAALAFAIRHLPEDEDHWHLYLEDDVLLHPEFFDWIHRLLDLDRAESIDCWYLCNRKNPVLRQWRVGDLVLNQLKHPILGTHALLLPRKHLPRLLNAHWNGYADQVIFNVFSNIKARIVQVVDPVLVEHIGECSTFSPTNRQTLEVNLADPSNPGQAA